MKKVKIQNIPKHVAFIMDGNRRWARERKLPLLQGHKNGEDRIEPLVDMAIEYHIPYLTFWAFSTENWKRSPEEVGYLLSLYKRNLDKTVDVFRKKNVQVKVIGDLNKFPRDLQQKTARWIELTKKNKSITVILALSYGGRDEIIRAVNKILNNKKQITNNIKITKEDLEKNLDTAGIPDPDLMIRTGGERRLSGYLLWQMEYAEFYFTEKYWPEFTPEEFVKALQDYSERIRRFGR
ncbi:di-trans,poly-cis-decaprenylcistransferase [Candidatus Gottesmanbacteria bacterium RIFCSPHIGHO2_02_FULL_39_11]|uniref:Isoprenyl transferase n=1 Tax=Candidatus Gottesmanbacteria bacterium RIFCSPHIGHO2_02_FULL_39_11 TaxID=1798382 RepID=A0A1F5ZUF6_9BACT|nr:MAG: di-trans,poly-cis-decaprenylcistransferase [Candidatus Gottesmanbacteria bacterium RIFCSPHIGHO2_02_FULL_39_11]